MAKDFDRKALKEDAFQDSMFWLADWVYQRRLWFIAGVSVVLVFAIAGFGFYYYRQRNLEERTARYYQIERQVAEDGLTNEAAVAKARKAFEEFSAAYPSSELGIVAQLHVARLAWKQDDLAGARTAFQAVLAHSGVAPSYLDLARIGLAKLEESEGHLDASADQYKLLADKPYEELKALSLGRIAAARNQPEEARQYFEKAARTAPNSLLGEWARQNMDYHP